MRVSGATGLAAVLIAAVGSVAGLTSANVVAPSRVSDTAHALAIVQLIPPECQGMPITSVSADGTNASDLILGTTARDTLNGDDGDDCILGGGGNDSLRGHHGYDVCIGGPGTDSFHPSCEEQIQ